ncbi:protein kinase domain-containing protein [Rubritalea tangerina]|uniref:non-specific serine/threonine protein kinase n=1 Tax=Rubritalea tangerina TaxID=430798 RepID=A0ABW4ZCM7_9BACT
MQAGERYRIIEPLGSGGFGSVYKAHDTMLHRDVAVKRLDRGVGEDALREQLLREARVLATMQHPNIVSIYDISTQEDFDEIVMELLVGVSLDKLVKRHLLQPSDFQTVGIQILQALSAAHQAGVLHCDVKPENIMLCLASDDRYEAKVYDFGMSLPTAEEQEAAKTKLMGSIYVMAPELFSGEKPSEKSDLYALGCVLYYILTGVYPFTGDNSIQVMAAHIKGEYPCPRELRSDVSEELAQWLARLLRRGDVEAYTSAKEALNELKLVALTQKEDEFTLSTESEGRNSRLVRAITVESLAQSDEGSSGKNSTAFLSNSFAYAKPVGKKAVRANTQDSEVKSSIESEEELVLPSDAEWYFTIKDKVKGPVSVEQLKKLCLEGKVTADTLVWHELLGDWVAASSCAETKAAFENKLEKEQEEETQRIEAQRAAEARHEEVIQEEKRERYAWLGIEVLIVVLAGLVTLVFSLMYPDVWQYGVATYFLTILAVGMSASRIYQLRNGQKWSVFVPFIGDLYHAATGKNTRALLSAMMVVTGGLGLATFFYGEAKALEARIALGQQSIIDSRYQIENEVIDKNSSSSAVISRSGRGSFQNLSSGEEIADDEKGANGKFSNPQRGLRSFPAR